MIGSGVTCAARCWSRGPPSIPESQSSSSARRSGSQGPPAATPSPDTSAQYFAPALASMEPVRHISSVVHHSHCVLGRLYSKDVG